MSTFFIQQFGCRATQADGAAIERQLREQGCAPAPDFSTADVVVLNTCTVTAAADTQARDAIRKIHAANPATRILVTGCYAQRAPEEIAALPGVSFVVGNSHKPQIPKLLHSISVQRLRISSIEPLDVTQDLIDFFASNHRIAPHFHMPLQSASDRILAAMHRWYRSEHYARRVELIHDRLPNAAIGADVITGFPGETHADHTATLDFIAARPFTYLHVFSYSQRPGTKAASLSGQLQGNIIKTRARELRSLADSKSAAFRRSQIGRTLRVLTLRRDPTDDSDSTPALSENYLQVRLPVALPPNQFLDATVTRADEKLLLAEPLEAASIVGE